MENATRTRSFSDPFSKPFIITRLSQLFKLKISAQPIYVKSIRPQNSGFYSLILTVSKCHHLLVRNCYFPKCASSMGVTGGEECARRYIEASVVKGTWYLAFAFRIPSPKNVVET